MKRVFKFAWIVFCYASILYLLAQNWVVLIYLLTTLIAMIRGHKHSENVWLNLDKTAAAIVHNKRDRTISGFTGEMASKKERGYVILEKAVNFLFNDKDHCFNRWQKEIKINRFMESL